MEKFRHVRIGKMVGTEKIYRNREWLREEYSIIKRSSPQIAKECKVNPLAIRYWLRKFSIPIRSIPEATSLAISNHVALTKEALEFLYGNLLGDGHLCTLSEFSACLIYGSKYKSYLEWSSAQLVVYGIGQAGKINKHEQKLPRYSKTYVSFHYDSKSYIELKGLHSRWYRSATEEERAEGRKFIKIVPFDLELTALICRQWYIGDGNLDRRWRVITMATGGFEEVEVNHLVGMLCELKFRAKRQKDNTIRISQRSASDFLNYIGPCPIKCYEYKWNLGNLKPK